MVRIIFTGYEIPTYEIYLIVSLCLLIGLFYAGCCWALPRPIPGIPYHKDSAKRILGDIPSMMKHVGETNEVFSWMTAQCIELDSPIVQLFVRPMQAPKIVICDFRENQDIMMRRLKDFDRSDFFGDIFSGVIPCHHIHMPSNEKQKNQRRLLADTMTPTFLNEVAAPQIYEAVLDVINLWRIKASLARGHPLEASEDLFHLSLDAIWAATFASPIGTTKSQVQLLSSVQSLNDVPKSKDEPVGFPKAPTPASYDSVISLTASLDKITSSPIPRIHHWFLRRLPFYRKATAYKDQLMSDQFAAAEAKFAHATEKDEHVKSALEHLLQREQSLARKEGRAAKFDTPTTRDELLGFLVGGHDTTATTLTWGLKLLTDNPRVATTLRESLYQALAPSDPPCSTPSSPNQSTPPAPSAASIAKTTLPYLDAVIEEILRVGCTAPGQVRKTIRDTEVLGHLIPAGTDVFVMNNGPSYLSPAMRIDEQARSQSSRDAGTRRGSWEDEEAKVGLGAGDMKAFRPERWLKASSGVQGVVFDATAGPTSPFGFGPRGCFGKRLAYLEMRLVLVMIVWHFNLLKCPDELSSYAAHDKLTHHPQQCYLRLEAL